MWKFGWLYEKGWGVTQDYATARDRDTKAADKGDAERYEIIGDTAYERGRTTVATFFLLLQEALGTKRNSGKHARGPPGERDLQRHSTGWHGTPCLLENLRKHCPRPIAALALNPNDLMPESQ